jgi:hypothetical protein
MPSTTAATASQQAPSVNQPNHPLPALTTYELRDYRRDLETAIAFLDRQTPVPTDRARVQATLDDVIAEQDDRERLARA